MTDWNGSRAGSKIASMTVKTPVNFAEHSGMLVGYIPSDDDDRDPRLVLHSNQDGGVPETVMSEADLLAAIAMLENMPDGEIPDRTPVGTLEQMHAWARQMAARSKQKS